jgi:hypothetical protein
VSNMFGPLSVNMVIRKEHKTATFRHDEHCHECNRLRWTMTKHHCRNCGHKYCTWCITRKVEYYVGTNKRKTKEWTCNACLMSTFLKMTYAKRGLKLRGKDLVPFQRDVSTENGDGMAMMVSAGSRHTLFLRLDGKVLWCGRYKELPHEEEDESENNIDRLTSYEIEQAMERNVKRMRLGLVCSCLSLRLMNLSNTFSTHRYPNLYPDFDRAYVRSRQDEDTVSFSMTRVQCTRLVRMRRVNSDKVISMRVTRSLVLSKRWLV